MTGFLACERFGIPDRILVPVVFLIACALIVSRRPDAVTHAQFFFEDGAWWYAQAHDMGCLRPLIIPYRDYLVVTQRLAACVALVVPLSYAPLVMNLIGIGIEALPAAVLCSSRFAVVIPRAWLRLALGLLYVALPIMWGTMTTVTMAQWHLAVLACAVVLSTPHPRPAWRAFDVLAVAASALSGPFAIFLVPIIAAKWYARREPWLVTLGAIAVAGAIVQAGVIAFGSGQPGVRPPLGATFPAFLRVVVERTVYGLLVGETGYARIFNDPATVWLQMPTLAALGIALLALVGYAFLRGALELKLFLAFAVMVLAAALVFPTTQPLQQPYWDSMTAPGAANRYYLLLIFALMATLVWLAAQRSIAARAAGIAVLAFSVVFGVAPNWREPPPLDYDFARFVRKYERVPSGTRVQIPYPPGWGMVLTKP